MMSDHSCLVVYKQKTADDVRIRDWMSDVCSSDLKAAVAGHALLALPLDLEAQGVVGGRRLQRSGGDARTSVVSGTSVSVRVDPGGRRIIKQHSHSRLTWSSPELAQYYIRYSMCHSVIHPSLSPHITQTYAT